MMPVRVIGGLAVLCEATLGILAPTYNGQFVIGVLLMILGAFALTRDPKEPRP